MHKSIELCENALAIINSERYLHKERGYKTVIEYTLSYTHE